jgi:hypothetical protein
MQIPLGRSPQRLPELLSNWLRVLIAETVLD